MTLMTFIGTMCVGWILVKLIIEPVMYMIFGKAD